MSPDISRIRTKMIYASSKDRFKRELEGIQIELQATDPTEMGLRAVTFLLEKECLYTVHGMVNLGDEAEFSRCHSNVKCGDHVGVSGFQEKLRGGA
ncbi:hypothetical protein OROMI_004154 [Orobanche minor]